MWNLFGDNRWSSCRYQWVLGWTKLENIFVHSNNRLMQNNLNSIGIDSPEVSPKDGIISLLDQIDLDIPTSGDFDEEDENSAAAVDTPRSERSTDTESERIKRVLVHTKSGRIGAVVGVGGEDSGGECFDESHKEELGIRSILHSPTTTAFNHNIINAKEDILNGNWKIEKNGHICKVENQKIFWKKSNISQK